MMNAKPKALVIENRASVRDMLQEILNGCGYEVVTACEGANDLELFRQQACDLVMLDLDTPQVDGLLALRHVRALDARVAVIVMTGSEGEDARREARRLGARFLYKPFRISMLSTLIGRIRAKQDRFRETDIGWSAGLPTPPDMGAADRRRHYRARVSVNARVGPTTVQQDARWCHVQDISLGGMRYRFNGLGSFAVGTEVQVRFDFRSSADLLLFPGTVVWADATSCRSGVQFGCLSANHRRFLEDTVVEALGHA